MNIKQILIVAVIVIGGGSLSVPAFVNAAPSCGGVPTSLIDCSAQTGKGTNATTKSGVWGLLVMAIQIMTAGVGILAVGGIVYGAILYTSAGGSAEQVKKAVGIITNVVVGLIAYGLMFAITNFLIPGGLFT